jgi:hypothetical protein
MSNIGTAIDSAAVKRNQQYIGLRQDTSGVDLTNVAGDLDEMRMSSVQDLDEGLGHALKLKNEASPEKEQMGDTGQNFLDAAKSARREIQQM